MLLRKISIAAAAATIISAFGLGAADATTIWNTSPVAASDSPIVQTGNGVAKHKHNKTVWVYNGHRHGARYRYRRAGYGYYYGGYWYARPWWTIGVPMINLCIGC
jgi:hypothetical protein